MLTVVIVIVGVVFFINKCVDLVAGQEAPHTIAEGMNIIHRFHCDFSNLNDSGISSFHHFICACFAPLLIIIV